MVRQVLAAEPFGNPHAPGESRFGEGCGGARQPAPRQFPEPRLSVALEQHVAGRVGALAPLAPPPSRSCVSKTRPQPVGKIQNGFGGPDCMPEARMPRRQRLQVPGPACQMVVHRAGDATSEQIEVDAALLALPFLLERLGALDLFAQPAQHFPQAGHGVEAPAVSGVELRAWVWHGKGL